MTKKVYLLTILPVLAMFSVFYLKADNNTLQCAGYKVEMKPNSVGFINTPYMKISKPQVIALDTSKGCAVVSWRTSALSTSQVIFRDENPAYVDLLDKNEKSYWGYPYGTEQNNDAQAYHIMILNNLEKGKSYFLRAVSRPTTSAMPYISDELYFVFDEPEDQTIQNQKILPVVSSQQNKANTQTKSVNTPKYNFKYTYKFKKQYIGYVNNYDIEKFPVYKNEKQIEPKTDTALFKEGYKENKALIVAQTANKKDGRDMNLENDENISNTTQEAQEESGKTKPNLAKAVSALSASYAANDFFTPVKTKFAEFLNSTSNKLKENNLAWLLIVLASAIFVALMYTLQMFIEKINDNYKNYKLQHWMFSFLALAIVLALFSAYKLAMFSLAVFLLIFAWFLFKMALEDMAEEQENIKTNEKEELKDTELENK